VVGVRVEEPDITERVEGVFGTVILLGKKGANKPKKLGKRSGAPGGSGKVDSRVPSIREGSYLEEGIVNTFKDRI
jgi:hypothetical protein